MKDIEVASNFHISILKLKSKLIVKLESLCLEQVKSGFLQKKEQINIKLFEDPELKCLQEKIKQRCEFNKIVLPGELVFEISECI